MENEEKYIKMERQYQDSLDSQKRYYESEIELLKSKVEYEKEKIRIDCETKSFEKIKELEAYYDVKNTEDLNKLKQYYINELESQKNWYEEEIIRRCKETENWHLNNTKEKTERLIKSYEEMLNAADDKYKAMEEKYKLIEENLTEYVSEQQKHYENELKPFKKIIKIKNKIHKKLNKIKSKKTKNINSEETNANEIIYREEHPKVSVILPVYNVGKYLRQSLDSIINQSLKDIEIICINDGSTDESYDILEEYKQKDYRIKVIHKENKGTGAARNDGLRLATGECIGFVDPDDWIKPNMFERLYNLIKEQNLDIAMCMPDGFDEKNQINSPFPYFIDANFENIPLNEIFNWKTLSPFKYPMCVWNKLYTKELFDKNNIEFAEGLDFEDHKVIFGTLLTAEKIMFIKEKLYVYRFNREGSVLSDNNQRLIDHIEIFNIVENLMKDTGTYNVLRNDFNEYKIHNLLYYYSMIKDEFKQEYYNQMIKSLRETNLSPEEYKNLCEKYPELSEIRN